MTAHSNAPQDVSRETLERLSCFHELLLKWNPRINLIAKSTTKDVWSRHIWDSAQLYALGQTARSWADLGSGGGFPGLIIAILSKENDPRRHFHLVESDQRKASFLRTVIRELRLSADVHVARIESLPSLNADVVSARALAPLDRLLGYLDRHMAPDGFALVMKGENWQKEVEIARKTWSFGLEQNASVTSPNAAILKIKELQRV